MLGDAMFALATLSPCFIIIVLWLLLRRHNRWLRLLGAGFYVFASPIIGFVLVLSAIDYSAPGPRNPGTGIAVLPMVLVYFIAMIAVIIAELTMARKQGT